MVEMRELYFAVGNETFGYSWTWKVWSHKFDAYMISARRGEKVPKFSFHKSGECRYAEVDPNRNGQERLIHSWHRRLTPENSRSDLQLVLRMNFPNSHLSKAISKPAQKVKLVEPTERQWADHIEIVSAKMVSDELAEAIKTDHHRRIIGYVDLKENEKLLLLGSKFHCSSIDYLVEKSDLPGGVFGQVLFPENDETQTGRPVRVCFITFESPPETWELGGYQSPIMK